jgi:F0F1-type ATP synthase membrane subunit b/b'
MNLNNTNKLVFAFTFGLFVGMLLSLKSTKTIEKSLSKRITQLENISRQLQKSSNNLAPNAQPQYCSVETRKDKKTGLKEILPIPS